MHGIGTGQRYNNKKVLYKGTVYQSTDELKRWLQLQALEREGKITELRRQVRYPLLPAQDGRYRHERPCVYNADFVYKKDGEEIVEDCKGARTPEYVLKRKLMLYLHGISIKET